MLSKLIICVVVLCLISISYAFESLETTSNTTTSSSGAVYGVDVSTTISSSSASCFVTSSKSFVVPRAYKSSGAVDTQACASLTNAMNAGIKSRDVYFFPSPQSSKSADTQMGEMVNYLHSNCKSAWSNRVWLDIEGSSYWLGNSANNQAWYKALVSSCSAHGVTCGIYSSASQWSAIFGSLSFSYGSSLPLWYAHYDGKASFSDFSPFAGWTTPYAKQYQGTTTVCSMGVDLNYSPSW